jgi:hypothetical protein
MQTNCRRLLVDRQALLPAAFLNVAKTVEEFSEKRKQRPLNAPAGDRVSHGRPRLLNPSWRFDG